MTAKLQRRRTASARPLTSQPSPTPAPEAMLQDSPHSPTPILPPIPLNSRAIFWQPRHSGGNGSMIHQPFLFWLIEVSRPVRIVQIGLREPARYLSLCQAADKLGTESLCIGVATDGPTSSMSKAAVEQHSMLYGDFSVLATDPISEATRHLNGGDVDLLIIDTPLTDDELKALHAHWVPRLSAQAIILMHAPEGNLANPEARKFFDALAIDKLSISFAQATPALEAILFGERQPEDLLSLARLKLGMPGHLLAQQIFARLGQGLENGLAARRYLDMAEKEKSVAKSLEQQLADAQATLLKEQDARKAIQLSEKEQLERVAELQATAFDLEAQLRSVTSDREAVQEDGTRAADDSSTSAETLHQELLAAKEMVNRQAEDLEQAKAELEAGALERDKLNKAIKLLREQKASLAAAKEGIHDHGDGKNGQDVSSDQAELHETVRRLEAQIKQSQAKRLAIWEDYESLKLAYETVSGNRYQAGSTRNEKDHKPAEKPPQVRP